MSNPDPRGQRGIALFVATLGAALASLVVLTALLLLEREVRSAAAWAAAVRVESGVHSALDRALSAWPASFGAPAGLPLGPVPDSLGKVGLALWLHPISDSTAWLHARATMVLGGSLGVAAREGGVLVRLLPDSLSPGRVRGAVPAGTGWDWGVRFP